jgi:anti-anti-sigma factor
MESDFSTEVETIDGATLIHVRGAIDMSTAERLRDAIEPFLGPEQRIVLDFAEVHFMDSMCLNVLVQARGSLTADGGSLVLRNPSAMARRILHTTGLQDLLDEDARDNPTSN